MLNSLDYNMRELPIRLLKQWDRVVKKSKLDFVDDSMCLEEYNKTVNSDHKYIADSTFDYWATPTEFTSCGGGDCEDFAIFKYFSLPYPRRIAVGLLNDDLTHAVLIVYSREHNGWVVLDCMHNDIIHWDDYLKRFNVIYMCDENFLYI